jgi:hypothetical protein
MKTKTIFSIVVALACTVCLAYCQAHPRMEFPFKVVDDTGAPIAGVKLNLKAFSHWVPGEAFGTDHFHSNTGITNEQGSGNVSIRSSRNEVYCWVSKSGFYEQIVYKHLFREHKLGAWHPKIEEFKVVLNRIRKPISLYANTMRVDGGDAGMEIPLLGKPCGFDLVRGDWTAPYGKGIITDLLISISDKPNSFEVEHRTTLTVSFPNEGDGIQKYETAPGPQSVLRIPYFAPESGYQPNIVKTAEAKRYGVDNDYINHFDDAKESDNYYIRIRTKLDANGKVLSANYAKLVGPIVWSPNFATVRFEYYFNPSPNDRNLEFNPEKNLYTHKLPCLPQWR